MDTSPQPSKPIPADSVLSEPAEVQESPIFSYISNLSPIKPVKSIPAPHSFPGLNSPPLVFTSPRVHPFTQSTFLKRPQFGQISGERLSACHEKFKDTDLVSVLSSCPPKGFPSSISQPEKAGGPSASADDFLTDDLNTDGGSFPFPANLSPKISDETPKTVNVLTDKDCATEIDRKDDKKKDVMDVSSSHLHSGQADGEHQVKPSSNTKTVEGDSTGDCDVPSEVFSKADPHSSTDRALSSQCSVHSSDEKPGCEHVVTYTQLAPPENVQEPGNCGENIDFVYSEAVENKLNKDHILEVGQCPRGTLRRCLQFEDGQQKMITNSIFLQNTSESANLQMSPASPEDLKVTESSSLDKPASSGSGLVANLGSPSLSPQHNKNCTTNVFDRPSGIGLHLNSIVNSMQMGSGTSLSVKSAERSSSFTILGKKSIPRVSCHSFVTTPMEGVSMSSEDDRDNNYASFAANIVTNFSANSIGPLNESLLVNHTEQRTGMYEKKNFDSKNADSVQDFSSSSPKRRRKKGLEPGDSIGCKRCNCKKTNCLKLYCDCFAAGIYCAEPCACQGCFNKPEYEDTVLDTREQIQSRNPLAFGPKIIQHLSESPASSSVDDHTRFTPASARHKRGCNCKKSKCLKKYCECYQANVGCADGCRCEGCENVYGRKEEYGTVKDLITKQSTNELLDSFDVKQEAASRDGIPHTELYNHQNLTPPTPPFQCSNHGKGASKSWFSSGRYLPSPESGLPLMVQYGMSPGLAINLDTHNMTLEGDNDIMDLVSIDQELDYGSADVMNQFSPRFDGPRSMGNPTALPNLQNLMNATRAQVYPGNPTVSSACSLRWRSSPTTPMMTSGTKLLEVVDSDGVIYNVIDDGTPEILKQTPPPPNAVKVSSPNKKRISPPHARTEQSTGSSVCLRTSRKFILKAVSSFPSLTPCMDSKVDAAGKRIDGFTKME